MNDEQISDIWMLFKEYVDKKQLEALAEKYVDFLADLGIDDFILKECIGVDAVLDTAITYYLDVEDNDDEDDWDE